MTADIVEMSELACAERGPVQRIRKARKRKAEEERRAPTGSAGAPHGQFLPELVLFQGLEDQKDQRPAH